MQYDITEIEGNPEGFEIQTQKLGATEVGGLLFAKGSEFEYVHFCHEDGIWGYHVCAGDNCLLCKLGKARVAKFIMAFYNLIRGQVMALPVSDSMNPNSLRPKIMNFFKYAANKEDTWRTPVFLARSHSNEFTMTTGHVLQDTVEAELAIQEFRENYQDGDLGKAAHYRMSDEELLLVQEIREMASLKGVLNNKPVHSDPFSEGIEGVCNEVSRSDGGDTDIPSEAPYLNDFA